MLIQTSEQWELAAGTASTQRLCKDLKVCNGRGTNLLIQELLCRFVTYNCLCRCLHGVSQRRWRFALQIESWLTWGPCSDDRVGPQGGWQSMACHPESYTSACAAQLPSPSYQRILPFGQIPTSQCWLLPPERPKVPRDAQSNSSPLFQMIPAHFSCAF